jgi:hypothetical protein
MLVAIVVLAIAVVGLACALNVAMNRCARAEHARDAYQRDIVVFANALTELERQHKLAADTLDQWREHVVVCEACGGVDARHSVFQTKCEGCMMAEDYGKEQEALIGDCDVCGNSACADGPAPRLCNWCEMKVTGSPTANPPDELPF